jgi:hypothetical protein
VTPQYPAGHRDIDVVVGEFTDQREANSQAFREEWFE